MRKIDGNATNEIEITDEMIEAGKSIIYDCPAVFSDPFGADCDVGELVEWSLGHGARSAVIARSMSTAKFLRAITLL